jgi:hypothetical protein
MTTSIPHPPEPAASAKNNGPSALKFGNKCILDVTDDILN